MFSNGRKTIQSISIMPFALMFACIKAVIGLLIGNIYSLVFGAIFSSIPAGTTAGINLSALSLIFGVGAIIVMPIIGFIAGLVIGIIIVLVYNFLAPRIGGIKLRFKQEYRQPPQP